MDILTAKEARDYDHIIAQSAGREPAACRSATEAHAVGKAYEKKHAFSQSLPWYIQSYQLDPRDERFGMAAGVCLACRKYDTLRELCDMNINDTDGYFYRASRYELALRDGGSQEEQIAAIEAFLDVQYEESYMLRLAMLYLENEREKEAGRLCKKVVRLFIDTKGALYAKALADAIKAGDGLRFIHENPWLEDNVFKHLSFDPAQPAPEDVTLRQPAASRPEAAPAGNGIRGLFGKKDKAAPKKDKISPIVEKSMEDVVGMNGLKTSLNSILGLMQLEKKRSGAGLDISKNITILGPDGCGKTTAAFAACRALNGMGLVAAPNPVTTDYDALCTDNDEELHDRIQNLFEQAENGCLLIENLHEFDDSGAYSIGHKIIDLLTKAYEAAEGAVMLIITGAQKETEELLQKKRRFAALFTMPPVVLGTYTVDELMEITDRIADRNYHFILDDTAKLVLRKKIENLAAQPEFTYSRDLSLLIDHAVRNVAKRLMNKRRSKDAELYIITEADIEDSGESLETVEELLQKLYAMTGLASVKEEVTSIVNQVRMKKRRAEAGIKDTGDKTLHLIFTGNAGTGKTTVARILGKIYRRLGVLPKGQLIECTRKDLISNIVGATDKQVSAKVREAMGGILFIDEAYALCRDDSDTYGMEAVQTLLTEIENHRGSFMVILAGYDAEMDTFMDKNQGLRSRIPTTIHFDDYSEEEMLQIFKDMIRAKELYLDAGTDDLIRAAISARASAKDFGNARGIRNLVEEVLRRQDNRLAAQDPANLSKNDYLIIKREDLAIADEPGDNAKNHKTVQDYLDELNAMTGLASVKREVSKIVAMMQANAAMKELGLAGSGFGTLHMVFKGNAGTGKTTVARIISNIYRELGVLSQGQLVECNRSSLVASYVGQTAAKTRAKVMEALGGILFIDEAYSLAQGGDNDFGKEAIDELVADIENYRSDLCVIIAGYSSDMDRFLEMNQGLSSRFPNTIYFEDYTPDEMVSILHGMLSAQGLRLADGTEPLVTELIAQRAGASDFGNARGIRNLRDKLIEYKNLRVTAREDTANMTKEQQIGMWTTITAEDVQMLLNEGK